MHNVTKREALETKPAVREDWWPGSGDRVVPAPMTWWETERKSEAHQDDGLVRVWLSDRRAA